MMNTRKTLLATALAGVLAAGGSVPAAGVADGDVNAPPLAGVRILLANDDSVQAARPDGADGRGLYELRKSLCRAGADVVVVGPWGQQSGRSRASAAAAQVTVAPPADMPDEYAADCSTAPSRGVVLGVCQGAESCEPASASVTSADAVDLALGTLLADRVGWSGGPDVVLSGINSGANTDLSVNLSGTVGAATAALEHGAPAIAVSAGTRATSVPSVDTYRTVATYATGLVERVLAGGVSRHLVRDQVLLNVNGPDVAPGVEPEPRWTDVGGVALDRFSYRKSGADTYQLAYGAVEPAPRLSPNSDTAALARGYISVSAVSADRGRPGKSRELERVIAGR